MTETPEFIGWRKLWKHDGLLNMHWKQEGPTPITEEAANYDEATLVGSDGGYNYHMPVLDIDFPAALVPSSTEGHFHLYLNIGMPWETYAKLLEALEEAGVIQEGFYKMAILRKQTFVRRPGVKKKPGEELGSE